MHAVIKVLKAPYTLFSLHGAQIFNNRLSIAMQVMRTASNKNCTTHKVEYFLLNK
jgi:hypothetical protein